MRIAVQVDLVPLDLDWSWRMMYTIHGLGRAIQHRIDLWGPERHHKTLGLSNEMPLASALQNRPLVQCLSVTSAARSGLCTDGRLMHQLLPFRPGRVFQAGRVYRAGAGHRGRINAGQWRIGFRAMSAESETTFGGCDEIWVGSHCGTKPCLILPVSSSTILRNPTSTAPPGLSSSHAAAASRDIETLHT